MIRPGCTLGILGGGQLGRMIAMAAAQLGLKTHVYAPDENSPAFEVATEVTIAPYEDEANLVRFAKAVDVVTYEFENVPSETAAKGATGMPRPAMKLFSRKRSWDTAKACALGARAAWTLRMAAVSPGTFSNS